MLEIHGPTSERIGALAHDAGIMLYELSPQQVSLEDALMRIARDAVEYKTQTTDDEDLELVA